jgi:hypothetical protein
MICSGDSGTSGKKSMSGRIKWYVYIFPSISR